MSQSSVGEGAASPDVSVFLPVPVSSPTSTCLASIVLVVILCGGCTRRSVDGDAQQRAPRELPAPLAEAGGPPLSHSTQPVVPRARRAFPSLEVAVEHVLATRPRVLAVGEVHPTRGVAEVQSAAQRFEGILPHLAAAGYTRLILELVEPPSGCGSEVQKARTAQRKIAALQAPNNQSQYVALATKARALGIVPFPLRPTCERMRRAATDPSRVAGMLALVTDQLRDRALTASAHHRVVLYGGAMHNDAQPRPELAEFSFGATLRKRLGADYVELDLIVPEYIRQAANWRALPWFENYSGSPHRQGVVMFTTAPGALTLVLEPTQEAPEVKSAP